MSLLKTIRSDRARQGRRQPHARRSVNTVGCVIKAYGLDETFLKRLDGWSDAPGFATMRPGGVKAKPRLDVPPYALLPEADYRLAEAIVERVDNPYLAFAHSPEEILLSGPLFAATPSLTPRELLRADFETLLAAALATRELAGLEAGGEPPCGPKDHREAEGPDEEASWPPACRERVRQLRAFVRDVETMEVPTE